MARAFERQVWLHDLAERAGNSTSGFSASERPKGQATGHFRFAAGGARLGESTISQLESL